MPNLGRKNVIEIKQRKLKDNFPFILPVSADVTVVIRCTK